MILWIGLGIVAGWFVILWIFEILVRIERFLGSWKIGVRVNGNAILKYDSARSGLFASWYKYLPNSRAASPVASLAFAAASCNISTPRVSSAGTPSPLKNIRAR